MLKKRGGGGLTNKNNKKSKCDDNFRGYFANVFILQNPPQNMEHSLYTLRISCEFCVLLMPQKINHECRPWHEMQKAKKGRKM